jgi:UDP-2,3-diacylglucosamine pyrophosphatase LpxH
MPKFKIIVSDFHLGAGPPTGGNPLEDFTLDDEFAVLLAGAVAESERDGADVELILNGDTFEMLQVPHLDSFDPAEAYPPEWYHSSLEENSARKMALIILGHPTFFQALRSFIEPGPPQRCVTFVKGNHDIDLHWLEVQQQIRQALDAAGDRSPLLSFVERRIRREGIYVEHGNQYAERVDQVKDMEEPHDPSRLGQLDYPPGSWFVMNFLNEIERERYWVDGVKPITSLIWFALRYDFLFAARAIATLLRVLPGTIEDALLAVDASQAEVLAQQLEDPQARQEIARRYRDEPAFRARFNAALAQILTPPPTSRGEAALALVPSPDAVSMGEEIQQRMRSSLFDAARRRAMEEDVHLIIFGHTHEAGGELLPGGGVYINSGTWTWKGDFSGAGEGDWQELFEHPERFTDDRMMTYVRVDYDDSGLPHGRLLEFERD